MAHDLSSLYQSYTLQTNYKQLSASQFATIPASVKHIMESIQTIANETEQNIQALFCHQQNRARVSLSMTEEEDKKDEQAEQIVQHLLGRFSEAGALLKQLKQFCETQKKCDPTIRAIYLNYAQYWSKIFQQYSTQFNTYRRDFIERVADQQKISTDYFYSVDYSQQQEQQEQEQEQQQQEEEIKKLAETAQELAQLFTELDWMISKQGDIIDLIDASVVNTEQAAEQGAKEIKEAAKKASYPRAKWLILFLCLVFISLLIAVIEKFK